MKHFTEDLSTRPVVGLEDEYPPCFVDPSHTHRRAQLLYASTGVMSVTTPHANFVIPPQRALWIPSGVAHEVSCRGHVALRTLYFDDQLAGTADWPCRVIEISDFLKALIVEMARIGSGDADTERVNRIAAMLIDELRTMPAAPYRAPMPSDPRLLKVCKAIIADPADQRDLDGLARLAGMGRRTFTRLFRAETGIGLAVWRQQIRLMEALSMLAAGKPITSVAFDVGYDSPSAFSAMFHRSFGVSPSQYPMQAPASGPVSMNIGPLRAAGGRGARNLRPQSKQKPVGGGAS